jgi:hypothetical protein
MQEKFNLDIKSLDVVKRLEEYFLQLKSNDSIYWNIYHDAPEHIKERFKKQEWYKSEYDYDKEKENFINEINKKILD